MVGGRLTAYFLLKKGGGMVTDEGANNLINAIILKAVEDTQSKNERIKEEAYNFLKSDYAQSLTNVDLEYIVKEIISHERKQKDAK